MFKMTELEQRQFYHGARDCRRGVMPIRGASDAYMQGYATQIGGLK